MLNKTIAEQFLVDDVFDCFVFTANRDGQVDVVSWK